MGAGAIGQYMFSVMTFGIVLTRVTTEARDNQVFSVLEG